MVSGDEAVYASPSARDYRLVSAAYTPPQVTASASGAVQVEGVLLAIALGGASTRVLCCAPSDSAADVIVQRLHLASKTFRLPSAPQNGPQGAPSPPSLPRVPGSLEGGHQASAQLLRHGLQIVLQIQLDCQGVGGDYPAMKRDCYIHRLLRK